MPGRYSTFTVEPGIYYLGTKIKKLAIPTAILARTLITPNINDIDIEVNLLDNKIGIAAKEHIDVFKEKTFPMFLTLEKDVLPNVITELNQRYKELEEIKETKANPLDAMTDAALDDDTGLIL